MCLACSPFDGWPIECICQWSKGFIICGDNGLILFFERSTEDPRLLFGDRPSRTLRIKQAIDIKIRAITLSPQPAEDWLVVTTENHQMYKLSMSALDRTTDDTTWSPMIQYFHQSQITGLDVCIRKQMIVTCGLDKTVRIWNYNEKTLEV